MKEEIDLLKTLIFMYIMLILVLSLFIANVSKRLDNIEWMLKYSDYVLQDSLLQGGIYNGN